jgi:hypothetical protein
MQYLLSVIDDTTPGNTAETASLTRRRDQLG